MFKTPMRTAKKNPRFLGELRDLCRAKVSASEFKYSQGTEIFGQAKPADYIYQVVEGAVRTHKLLSDGRRQIGAFHLPGDIFGLENSDVHRFTAEAIINTTVRLMKRQSLERVAKTGILRCVRSPPDHDGFDNLEHVENPRALVRCQDRARNAWPRFSPEMNGRARAGGVIALPMNRRDIAGTISASPWRPCHVSFQNFNGRVSLRSRGRVTAKSLYSIPRVSPY